MTPSRVKLALLLVVATTGAITLASSTGIWFVATVEGMPLAVPADRAAPAVVAFGVASLALAAALAIAGPVFRVVLGLLQAALGASIALFSILAVADPVGGAVGMAAEVAGVTGESLVVSETTATWWPWAVLTSGVVGAIAGVAVALSARHWPASSSRYSATRLEPDANPAGGIENSADAWDALSTGSDPTRRADALDSAAVEADRRRRSRGVDDR